MELRHLHYFIAVAEELSFTRAAERLHIAQPPLSVQIRQLEEEIGTPLLQRTKRHVALTPAGRVFLDEARRALGIVDRGVQLARDMGQGRRGSLRLGAVYSSVYAVVPSLLRLFGRYYPHVAIELEEMTVQQQLDALAQGKIDVGILRSPINEPAVETRLLFRETIVALVPRDHPLVARGAIHLADLVGLPFILSGIGLNSSFRQHVLDIFNQRGLSLSIAREVGEIHSIISLVGAGLGVALAPMTVSRIHVDDVCYLPIIDETPPIEVSLAWAKDVKPPVLSSLLDLIETPELQTMLASLDRSETRSAAPNSALSGAI